MNSVVDFSMYMHPYNYHLDHTIGHFNFCNLLLCLFSQFIQQLSRGNDYSDLCRGRLGWPVLEFHINELHCILVCLTCWVGVMFSKFIPVHLCYVCVLVCAHTCAYMPPFTAMYFSIGCIWEVKLRKISDVGCEGRGELKWLQGFWPEHLEVAIHRDNETLRGGVGRQAA